MQNEVRRLWIRGLSDLRQLKEKPGKGIKNPIRCQPVLSGEMRYGQLCDIQAGGQDEKQARLFLSVLFAPFGR